MGSVGRRAVTAVVVVVACLLAVAAQAHAQSAPGGRTAVSLPSDLASGAVSFTHDGRSVSFRLLGARGKPTREAQRAVIRNALPGVTLRYTGLPEGLKEELLIARRQAAPRKFSFELKTSEGLEPVRTRDKRVLRVDESRRLRMVIPAPLMFDSKSKPALSRAIGVSLRRVSDDRYRLTLTPSRRWLDAESRAGQ